MLGENIRKQRALKGLKQEYVAKRIGLSQSAYSRIERGETKPSYETVQAIADAIGCHICDFAETSPQAVSTVSTTSTTPPPRA